MPYGQDIPLDTLISVATDAARQAGAVLAECTRKGFRIEHKQTINLVTDADHQAEQRIIDVIHDAWLLGKVEMRDDAWTPTAELTRHVEAGELGVKSGRGFLEYPKK